MKVRSKSYDADDATVQNATDSDMHEQQLSKVAMVAMR